MKVGIHTRLKPGAVEQYEEYHKAPMRAAAHDYSGKGRDRLPLIFELPR